MSNSGRKFILRGFPPLIALVSCCLTGSAESLPRVRNQALIQERGRPLHAGYLTGSSHATLERAAGGDTPVMTFLSDRGPVRLLLDTGASAAMVTPSLVQRLALRRQRLPPEMFSLVGGGANCHDLEVSSTRLPPLRLLSHDDAGNVRLNGLEALVIPVEALPKGVDGVLGAPSLRQLPFVVDPVKGELLFGDSALQWRSAMALEPHAAVMSWRRGVPLLSLRIRSSKDQKVMVISALADTGAEGLFLSDELTSSLFALGPAQSVRLVGVCGSQWVRRQRLTGIGLGSQSPTYQMIDAIFTSNPVFSSLGIQAILGQEWLRNRLQFWDLTVSPPRLEVW